jgi:ATP-dependent Lhr-like helicase
VLTWFRQRFGVPTEVQRLAWPLVAAGQNVLISAPTGTGKTLAAFLPILDNLLFPPDQQPSGLGDDSRLRCLYVSPLKALASDACRSLEAHLAGLRDFLPAQTDLPRLAVRTGDTSAEERRLLRDDPPDILLTTPESLAVLLSQESMESRLANLRWLVVDEVHALAANKRGADLALSMERLEVVSGREVSGESCNGPLTTHHSPLTRSLQRIGLSATATPLDEAARFLAGAGRPCAIACTGYAEPPQIRVSPLPEGRRFLSCLVERLTPELHAHRATLIFTNARGLAERLAWALRRQVPEWNDQIAVHHSALAPARRHDIEQRFKGGGLRAVVSSTSLEMGIDIGTLDLVVLVHPPGDVVRLLQRVGRSGHAPPRRRAELSDTKLESSAAGARCRVRRGLVLTSTPGELLEATVTTASGLARQCEPLRMPRHPLDVLCQQILGMVAVRSWMPDDLFELVRRSTPFADLSRSDFDDCLAYLRGLGRDGQPWLPARVRDDGDCIRIRDERTARLLRRNLGTIIAEDTVQVTLRGGTFATCQADGHVANVPPQLSDEADPTLRTVIGEVDEAFADRIQPGDRFLLDGRCLEVRTREGGELHVDEVVGRPQVPRWASEGWPLSPELAARLYVLRMQAAEALRDGPAHLAELLQRDYGLDGSTVEPLVAYFERQEAISEIPDRDTLLIEGVVFPGGAEYYLHTPLNRLGNDALARVAVSRLTRDHGRSATSIVADLGFSLRVRGTVDDVPAVMRRLLGAEGFDADLDEALADSVALRERFRRVALTGLMLLRHPEGARRRVGGRSWGERRLFEQVQAHDPQFVLLQEARREVRASLCDAAAGLHFAEEVPRLTLRCRWLPRPSPFAETWTQSAAGPAESVETPAEALQRLHALLTGRGENNARSQ